MAFVITFCSLFSNIALAITVSIISVSTLSFAESNSTVGFSVPLIHRDSPESPFYNPSLTHFERVSNALHRSANRVKHFKLDSPSPQAASSEVIPNYGEYLMKINVGRPRFEIIAVADTGSDLIWTQCSPCSKCYKQNAPLFNPKSSSSYKEIPCRSRQCQSIRRTSCATNGSCKYSARYGDKSYTRGIIGSETVSIGSTKPVSFPKIIFGCGYDNGGTFSVNTSGIVGLGGGQASLVSQMGSSIGGKFSYCLVPMFQNSTSQLHFGDKASVSGNGVVSTRMVQRNPKTFYYLALEGFTIGRQRLEFYDSSSPNDASNPSRRGVNIIIDSGSTMTYLPSIFYRRLERTLRKAIKLQPVGDPQKVLKLCYRYNDSIEFPIITAHFAGADVKLSPTNTFVRTSLEVVCLAVAPSNNFSIFGNLAQMNFLIGYDLMKRTVSFKPTDCSKE